MPRGEVTGDSIDAACKIACAAHDRGELDDDTLMRLLERLIDARACTNGYADRYGLPSQLNASHAKETP